LHGTQHVTKQHAARFVDKYRKSFNFVALNKRRSKLIGRAVRLFVAFRLAFSGKNIVQTLNSYKNR
jgi:hypothetical protein